MEVIATSVFGGEYLVEVHEVGPGSRKTYTYGFITPRTIGFKHQGVIFLGCKRGYKDCKYRFKFIIPVKPIYKAINLHL